MEKSTLIILAILGIATIGLFSLESGQSANGENLFKIWQQNNNKKYEDASEYYFRLQIWLTNLEYVNSHNAKYYAGV